MARSRTEQLRNGVDVLSDDLIKNFDRLIKWFSIIAIGIHQELY